MIINEGAHNFEKYFRKADRTKLWELNTQVKESHIFSDIFDIIRLDTILS